MYRHVTKHLAETLSTSCKYCHKTPAVWHYAGNEKICAHCGTRVYQSTPMPKTGSTSLYKSLR